MSPTVSNELRFHPYQNFQFRVKWEGRNVVGLSKVSTLKGSAEVVEHRVGGSPSRSHKLLGRIKFEAITLELGVTYDRKFEHCVGVLHCAGAG